jgi:hypothetical protein
MHKTLIDLDLTLLKSYKNFQDANENWNILSYLNYKYDMNAALAFSKFFFPDFIEVKGCIVLSFLYNQETFESWFRELNGEISEVEKMANLYELKDYFHINTDSEPEVDVFGQILKKSWEMNLSILYPEKKFIIKLFEEYNSKFITFHTVSQR